MNKDDSTKLVSLLKEYILLLEETSFKHAKILDEAGYQPDPAIIEQGIFLREQIRLLETK